ncbi:hypothetical protein SFUL_3713 [Streptomyces microflavus DSM 40593]|uniref:Uncharacterized protein n=1 Tax=Streptomyces microflavus DSM 40593 TaxID=1303692 RepID=N0CR27_STRMI|nr:hypothetical protein [Streptomyces microflavus]AGK78631.1 hypothetical protein SFUL_3713 [Streptomyces microflavus DSM 40593]
MATSKSSTPPEETRLDPHVDAPSTTAPGDGPADTTDPDEQATSATPDKGAAAQAGHGTVNAVVPVPKKTAAARKGKDRVETYSALRPDGTEVTVERNLETGESSVKEG